MRTQSPDVARRRPGPGGDGRRVGHGAKGRGASGRRHYCLVTHGEEGKPSVKFSEQKPLKVDRAGGSEEDGRKC